MKKGTIIFLNGVTSTGKTSISQAIQKLSEENYCHFSNDIFHELFSRKYIEANGYWKTLNEAILAMYHAAKTYSDLGINVIIDGMLLVLPEDMPSLYEDLKLILKESPWHMVHVYCPLDECKRRNIERGDRGHEQSQFQHDHMTENIIYDIEVDSSKNSPEECAGQILSQIAGREL